MEGWWRVLEGEFRDLGVGGGGRTLRDLRTVIMKKCGAEAEGMVVGKLEGAAPERIRATEKGVLLVRFFGFGRRRPEASPSRYFGERLRFPAKPLHTSSMSYFDFCLQYLSCGSFCKYV